LGNFFAAGNATIQSALASRLSNDYGLGQAIVVAIGALAFVVLAVLGVEAKDTDMLADTSERETRADAGSGFSRFRS
jgi:hypothetical protein